MRRTVEAGLVPTLEAASTFVETGTPRPLDSFPGAVGRSGTDRTDLAELLPTFVDAPFPVMRVLATAMLPMLDDAVLAQRVRRQLASARIPAAPVWLGDLDRPEPAGTAFVGDPLGDGDNVLVSMTWRGRRAATAVVYIDHNVGTLVKDAFVVPETLEATVELYERLAEREGHITTIDPADARARIAEAIATGERSIPPFETETWPGTRPLVEWWISLLPEGGTGYEYREWTSGQLDEVVEAFVASPFAAELTVPTETVRPLADAMAWFAVGSMPGDPLRWSPVSVEIALADWLPRKVRMPRAELRLVPDVMAAMVRYAHRERDIDASDTADTLESIRRYTPDFLDAIEGPPADPARNAARLARIAAGLDPDDPDEGDDPDDLELLAAAERHLIDEIGGPDVVAGLDVEPLGDEPFDDRAVPDGLRELVGEVVRRVDQACDADLDVELRTICRRYVAELVTSDPAVFRRSPRADLIAAGVVWAAVTLQLHDHRRAPDVDVPTQKHLAATMGVAAGSMSSRATTIRGSLEQKTDVTTVGPWHSSRRRHWLTQLAELARLRAEVADRDS